MNLGEKETKATIEKAVKSKKKKANHTLREEDVLSKKVRLFF